VIHQFEPLLSTPSPHLPSDYSCFGASDPPSVSVLGVRDRLASMPLHERKPVSASESCGPCATKNLLFQIRFFFSVCHVRNTAVSPERSSCCRLDADAHRTVHVDPPMQDRRQPRPYTGKNTRSSDGAQRSTRVHLKRNSHSVGLESLRGGPFRSVFSSSAGPEALLWTFSRAGVYHVRFINGDH